MEYCIKSISTEKQILQNFLFTEKRKSFFNLAFHNTIGTGNIKLVIRTDNIHLNTLAREDIGFSKVQTAF